MIPDLVPLKATENQVAAREAFEAVRQRAPEGSVATQLALAVVS